MTETRATAGRYPPGRYGRRRDPRPGHRWLVVLAAALVVVAALAISVRLFQQYGQPTYDPLVRRYYDVSDSGVTVEFEVRKPAGTTATCRLRARAANSAEIGGADVAVPLGDRPVVTYRLATSARMFAVDIPSCGPSR